MHVHATRHTPNLTPSDSVIQASAMPGMLRVIAMTGNIEFKIDMNETAV